MPGLLQTPNDGSWHGYKFVSALAAEFVGVMLFALFGSVVPSGTIAQQGSATNSGGAASNFAPWGNGLTLAVLSEYGVGGLLLCFGIVLSTTAFT